MAFHGWQEAADKLSALAARGKWDELPALVTDEMLAEYCLVTDKSTLAEALKARYAGSADRLALYPPFIPGSGEMHWDSMVASFK
jgi:alkanesulfonate monooxygenase SsuD/methylene tetrahydromethanopterin reductase-like flavin-dependent oxidoreductase (luciferase family)